MNNSKEIGCVCVGYEVPDDLNVCEMSDNRSIRTKTLQILVSCIGPGLLPALACVKGTDIPASFEVTLW